MDHDPQPLVGGRMVQTLVGIKTRRQNIIIMEPTGIEWRNEVYTLSSLQNQPCFSYFALDRPWKGVGPMFVADDLEICPLPFQYEISMFCFVCQQAEQHHARMAFEAEQEYQRQQQQMQLQQQYNSQQAFEPLQQRQRLDMMSRNHAVGPGGGRAPVAAAASTAPGSMRGPQSFEVRWCRNYSRLFFHMTEKKRFMNAFVQTLFFLMYIVVKN